MTDPLIGTQLDEYRLENLLGHGGMARVYRGLDSGLQRYAAVKVIDTPHQQNDVYIARFEREARAIAGLDHPHIVTVYRYGRAGNLLYLAMKYVEGADLHAILNGYEKDGQLMPFAEVTRLLREMGAALDYAHARGIVHRDIKPSNVMLDAHGRSYITDFGLALLADVGTRGEILGSPHYIAPEQAVSSAGAVPQSDLYALGVILYRMVTGRLPFEHSDLLELLMMHMTAVPPSPRTTRPEITPSLEDVILKALAKEPGARYDSGAALAQAVEAALDDTAVSPVIAAATLTIVDRVALDMETLPPVPAAVTPKMTTPRRTTPSPPETAVPPPPTPAFPLSFKAIGGAVVLLLIVLAAIFLIRGRANEGEAVTEVNGTAVTGVIGAETAEVVDISLSAGTVTAVITETATSATGTAVPALPGPPASTGETYLPVIAREEPPTPTPSPTATAVPTETPTPTHTAVPTDTPMPASALYILVFERKDETLFMSNQSGNPFPLPGLELRFGGNGESEAASGRRHFSEWEQDTLAAGACVHMSHKARDATDDIEDTACAHLQGDLLEVNWQEEFTVWYNDNEMGECEVEDDERCTVMFEVSAVP